MFLPPPPPTCRRDEALSAIQDAIREQQQQVLSVETEIAGYKRDIIKQQLANESVTAVLKKVEAEAGFVTQQIEAATEKQSRLSEVLVKLARSLEHTEEQIRRLQGEGKALGGEAEAVDRAFTKVWCGSRGVGWGGGVGGWGWEGGELSRG
jgi:chromosome segregation ATPase